MQDIIIVMCVEYRTTCVVLMIVVLQLRVFYLHKDLGLVNMA